MLRLHDIQVIINSATSVDRLQSIAQHQSQIAQSNMASQLNSEAELKKNQIQTAQSGDESEEISDRDPHAREKRHGKYYAQKRANVEKTQPEIKEAKAPGHRLDIKI